MIQIGAPLAADFADPLGVLTDCHRRIERFLQLLIVVSEQARGGELTAEQRAALDAALRYFAEAAPNHTADEEASLFPRLRAAGACAALDGLEKDHRAAHAQHDRVDALGRRWFADGRLPADAAQELAMLLHELHAAYQRHIAIEETEIFTLAGRILSADDLAELGREMARRRGLDPAALAAAQRGTA